MFRLAILCLAIISACYGAASINKRNVCNSFMMGGDGGNPFSDKYHYTRGDITRIRVRYSDYIHGVQFFYKHSPAPYHGRYGGKEKFIYLDADEFVVKVSVRADTTVKQLTFHTNKLIYGPYGGTTGTPSVAQGKKLSYISGRSSQQIDNIAFYFDC